MSPWLMFKSWANAVRLRCAPISALRQRESWEVASSGLKSKFSGAVLHGCKVGWQCAWCGRNKDADTSQVNGGNWPHMTITPWLNGYSSSQRARPWEGGVFPSPLHASCVTLDTTWLTLPPTRDAHHHISTSQLLIALQDSSPTDAKHSPQAFHSCKWAVIRRVRSNGLCHEFKSESTSFIFILA